MGSTTHSIEVNAPLRVVYNQWTQFEEFPRFMEGVAEVRQDGPNRLFWKAKIAGKDKQWEAEIIEQVPDKRIAWVSIDGTRNAGQVNFESLELERTLITLTMEYQPEGLLEMAGDVFGIPAGQVEGDLNHFRDFIEQSGKATGSWRGQIGGEENLHSAAGAAIAPAEEIGIEPAGKAMGSSRDGIGREENPDSTAGTAMGPVEEIGTQGILTESPETFETVALPSSFIAESKRPPTERPRQEIVTESVEPFHPRDNASGILDKPIPPAAELLGQREEPPANRISAEANAPSKEEIARRAYEIYLNRERDQVQGHAGEDWLQAERELSGETM
jgi:hypothetical protein